jgi:hypothetical protein
MPFDDELPREQIQKLHESYSSANATTVLNDSIANMYQATKGYLHEIGVAFYGVPDVVAETPSDKLVPANRERCLVALLTARGADFTLAVHIYVALMEGFVDSTASAASGGATPVADSILPSEIANIIFLTGVYTGADNLTRGLITLTRTLALLKQIAGESNCTPAAVLQRIRDVFKVFPEQQAPSP